MPSSLNRGWRSTQYRKKRSVKLATSNQLLVTGYLKKEKLATRASYLNQEKLATSSQLLVTGYLKGKKVGY
jgi:hypothetical protein